MQRNARHVIVAGREGVLAVLGFVSVPADGCAINGGDAHLMHMSDNQKALLGALVIDVAMVFLCAVQNHLEFRRDGFQVRGTYHVIGLRDRGLIVLILAIKGQKSQGYHHYDHSNDRIVGLGCTHGVLLDRMRVLTHYIPARKHEVG